MTNLTLSFYDFLIHCRSTQWLVIFGFLFGLIFSPPFAVGAPSITPRMVEQFKNLSEREQKLLAQELGVTLPSLTGNPGENTQQEVPLEQERTQIFQDILDDAAENEEMVEERNGELSRFGSGLFDPELKAFVAVDNALPPDGYLLGAGDQLNIQVFGKEPIDVTLEIDRDGRIALPRLGAVSLVGLTFLEAKEVISQKVVKGMLGSEVIVSLGELRKINVFLAGEIHAPGSYNVSALTTVSQALYLSGGISDIGSYRSIAVLRNNRSVNSFDLYDLLLKGSREGDITLRSGDVIFVPVAPALVTISGQVKRPAIYEVKEENLTESIAMAGGYTYDAAPAFSTIERFDKSLGLPTMITVGLQQSMHLINGDKVFVPVGPNEPENAVELRGAVVRAGPYQWKEGIRLSHFIGRLDKDLLPEADRSIGLIIRRKNIRRDIEILPFSPIDVAIGPGSDQDPVLAVHDRILILPSSSKKLEDETAARLEQQSMDINDIETDDLAALEIPAEANTIQSRYELLHPILEQLKGQSRLGAPEAIVSVEGAVKFPGRYPLMKDPSIYHLLNLAGGVRDGAFLKNLEVRRLQTNFEKGEVESRIIGVDLSSLSMGFDLESRDVVRINYLPKWNPDQNVILSGEVRFPGKYALREGETLRTILERAGGFTAEAFPESLRYTSVAVKELQRESVSRLVQRFVRETGSRATVGLDADNGRGFENNEYEQVVLSAFQGRIIVDIPRLLTGDKAADVLLQDGDKIDVPRLSEAVTVVGEVYEPGTFRYVTGQGLEGYIQMAAGFTELAKQKNMYVIKANGSIVPVKTGWKGLTRFSRQKHEEIEVGDVIVIPTDYDYSLPLDRYRSITSVVFESVASIAAFLSIAK
jgi:polysaccharide biosynthesis/export protein